MQVVTIVVGMIGLFTLTALGAWSLSSFGNEADSAPAIAWLSAARGLAQGQGTEAFIDQYLWQVFGLWAGMYAFSAGLCQTLLLQFRPLLILLAFGVVSALGLWFSRVLSLWYIVAYFPAGMVLLALMIRPLCRLGE